VPDGVRQREAEARIRKTFNLDQAKTTKEKADLGRTLLQTAASSGAKDAELYVFLRLARDLAAQALDSKTALGSIEAMAAAFDIDPFGEKSALLTKTQVLRGADPMPWARTCLEVAEQALKAEEYDEALRIFERADTLARGSNERAFADAAKQRSKDAADIKREAERAKPFLKLLETKPDDAEANAAVGRFLCLFKENWDRGLPMLAKGSDAALRKLGELELSKPSDAAAQATLGEAWAVQAEREPVNLKPRLRSRAAMWLDRAIPGLTGVARVSAEKKLASLGSAAAGKDRVRGITFQSAEQVKSFVTSGGSWRVENNELLGTCSGEAQWATFSTSYSSISQVTLRARIVPPAQNNLRVWVGPIHVIFSWHGADRDSYRNGKAYTDKPNSAVKAGKEYEISIKQQGSKVVVSVDGVAQWETEATLNGTVSIQAALDSTIGVRQLTIEGIPDFTKTVTAENRQFP
jgi:tetratricopeptide (TPR) repeat protein